jgi:hypothetical protein
LLPRPRPPHPSPHSAHAGWHAILHTADDRLLRPSALLHFTTVVFPTLRPVVSSGGESADTHYRCSSLVRRNSHSHLPQISNPCSLWLGSKRSSYLQPICPIYRQTRSALCGRGVLLVGIDSGREFLFVFFRIYLSACCMLLDKRLGTKMVRVWSKSR